MEVPLVAAGSDAFYTEVLRALTQLDQAAEAVLSRVSRGVARERERLGAIHQRLEVCEARIQAVGRDSSAAHTVFSPAALDSTSARAVPYVPLPKEKDLPESMEEDLAPQLVPPPSDVYVAEGRQAEDLWRVLHAPAAALRPEMVMEEERLGPRPRLSASPTLGDLLVFNSDYFAYGPGPLPEEKVDPRVAATKPKERLPAPLASAPLSILEGANLPDIDQLNYSYRPGETASAALALPLNLPLPDVASLAFGDGAATNIAPAAVFGGLAAFPSDLAQAQETAAAAAAPPAAIVAAPAANSTSLPALPGAPAPPAARAAPMAPAPSAARAASPAPAASTTAADAPLPTSRPAPGRPSSAAAAPAPAVQPPVEAVASDPAPSALSPKPAQQRPATAPGPAHPPLRPSLSFLADIKNSQSAPLKPAEKRKVAVAPPPAAKPMTFMDEVRNKMKRRQDALSGRQDRREQRRESRSFRKKPSRLEADPGDTSSGVSDDGGHESKQSLFDNDLLSRVVAQQSSEDDGDSDWDV